MKAPTGIATVSNSRRPAATSQYWSGMTPQKAQQSDRWSARSVGVRVTNSRSASTETKAKSTMHPAPPVSSETRKVKHITHQPLIRAFMLMTTARPMGHTTVRASTRPTPVARIRAVAAPTTIHASSRSMLSMASPPAA
jgi:hypothetical protein